jgi:hypothetical protein
MARSARAYVRGNTRRFYEWLETAQGQAVPQGPGGIDLWRLTADGAIRSDAHGVAPTLFDINEPISACGRRLTRLVRAIFPYSLACFSAAKTVLVPLALTALGYCA